jgi:Fe-S-cluster-containing hydrogenase component 2
MKPLLPRDNNREGMPTQQSIQKSTFEIFSNNSSAICWSCNDTPCMKISELTSPFEMTLKGSSLLEYNICPSSSITQNQNGEIEIDESTCSGCALCVLSCPVNAIKFNDIGFPMTTYGPLKSLGENFKSTRATVAKDIKRSSFRITSSLVTQSQNAVTKILGSDPGTKSVHILIRNLFKLNNFKARITIEGDTNDSFEIVAEKSEVIYPIEIAIGGDTLDSTRRIVSGCSKILSKSLVDITGLKPILVVDELPNSRSDIYNMIDDLKKYLRLDLKIVPLSVLQLIALTNLDLEHYFNVNKDFSPLQWYWKALQEISDTSDSELSDLLLIK